MTGGIGQLARVVAAQEAENTLAQAWLHLDRASRMSRGSLQANRRTLMELRDMIEGMIEP